MVLQSDLVNYSHLLNAAHRQQEETSYPKPEHILNSENRRTPPYKMPEVSPTLSLLSQCEPTNQTRTDRRSRARSPLPTQTHPKPHNSLRHRDRRHNRLRQSRHLLLRIPESHLQPPSHRRRAARQILLRDIRQEPACRYALGHDGVGEIQQ